MNINFIQWDALLRVCFTRSNKTIRANILSSKRTLENLYNIYCKNGGTVQNVSIFKDLVDSIIDETELGNSRAARMGEVQFLKLLIAFMKHNIYFCEDIDAEKYINELDD